MDAETCMSPAANVRESACGLYSYLSSGKSSAMAISFLPMSFHCSSTACDGLGAGFGGSFFAASCASTGIAANPAHSTTAPISFIHLIFSLLSPPARTLSYSDAPPSQAFLCFFQRMLCAGVGLVVDSRQKLDKFLFPLGLVVAAFGLRQLRDIHRAELRPAHRTEFRFFIEVIGKIFVVHRLRRRWIERQFKLLVPIKQEPCIGKRIIAVPRPRTMPRHIRRVRRDLVRDHSLLHVFRIRQPQVLLRRHV